MPQFFYKAKSGPDKLMEGTIEAESQSAAINKLNQMGYYPFFIADKGAVVAESKPSISLGIRRKVKVKELAIFTRQLADLLDAGITIFKSFQILQEQGLGSSTLRAVIGDVHNSIKDGATLSQSLNKHPKIFSPLYVSMVKAGEVSGGLEQVLERLADFAEKEDELRTKIMTALAYPALMAIVGTVTVFVLLTFVIPRLVTLFEEMGQGLPLITRILVAISQLFAHYYWLIIIVALFMYAVAKRFNRSKEGKDLIDRMKLRLPLLGLLLYKTEVSRFVRVLGTLLTNGVPMLHALRIVSETMTNEVIRKETEKILVEVERGEQLGKVMAQSSHFPRTVTNIVTLGEESGRLESSLLKISQSYDKEIDRTLKVVTSLLEPVLILVLGLIVGFIVIAMLLPIFQINILVR